MKIDFIAELSVFLGVSQEFIKERVEYDSNHASQEGLYTVPNLWKWMYGHREGNQDEHRLFYSVAFPYLFDLANFAEQFDIKKATAYKYIQGNCLDFGCGIGTVAFELQNKAKQVDAVDICITSIAFLEHLVKKYSLNINPIRAYNFIPDKKYDFIYIRDVFEHMIDRVEVMQKLIDSLAQDGVICEASPIFHYDETVGKENVQLKKYDIWDVLKENGFEVIESEITGGFSESNTNLWKRLK
jgi:2-polyprenyl-3-methyl-5-hydroxy-6-metoxy-1,4-benzoquinol methylase